MLCSYWKKGHGYFDMAGFALGVEDELDVFTQIATPGGLKLRIRDRVLRESTRAGKLSTQTRIYRSSSCT
jgi:hypothetical protein